MPKNPAKKHVCIGNTYCSTCSCLIIPKESRERKILRVMVVFFVTFLLIYFFGKFHINNSFVHPTILTLPAIFILGLAASTTTCMASAGAFFMATIGKLHRGNGKFSQSIIPTLSFNLGRILSYGFFGFLAGLLGKTILSNFKVQSLFTLVVSLILIGIALEMLKIVSFSIISSLSITRKLFLFLEKKLKKHPEKTSFFIGAITYLLPCGFTQSVQVYALGLANPASSAIVMMVFALGTVPFLTAIGFISSSVKHKTYSYFQQGMGIVVLTFGILTFLGSLSVLGFTPAIFKNSQEANISGTVPIENGYQIARMSVNEKGYSPLYFTVQRGIPVRWIVEGENVYGCQGSLIAPRANIQTVLKTGKNVFEFTPQIIGTIAFSCTSGMFQGEFRVVEG